MHIMHIIGKIGLIQSMPISLLLPNPHAAITTPLYDSGLTAVTETDHGSEISEYRRASVPAYEISRIEESAAIGHHRQVGFFL